TAEQSVRHLVELSGAPSRSPAARAGHVLGIRGTAAVALAAAAGESGARALLPVLLGAAAAAVEEQLTQDLADRAREQVRAAGEVVLEPLHDPDLAPDAAAVLR